MVKLCVNSQQDMYFIKSYVHKSVLSFSMYSYVRKKCLELEVLKSAPTSYVQIMNL